MLMSEYTFRSLTPIFKFDSVSFSHSGTYKNASFSIELASNEQGEAGYAKLMKYADERSAESLVSLHVSRQFGGTNIFLIVV